LQFLDINIINKTKQMSRFILAGIARFKFYIKIEIKKIATA